MDNEKMLLQKRFEELSGRSYNKGIWVYSDFLTTAQQALLMSLHLPCKFELFGGYEGAERRVACFGSEENCGYEAYPPIVCLKIEPLSQKFADALTHRDFLGSIMGLGVKREVLGDIIVYENCGYVFCLDGISQYICESLESVRRTTVKCAVTDAPPAQTSALPDEEEFIIASPRLDAVIASVYNFSRNVAKEAVEKGLVSVNSVLSQNPAAQLNEHDRVSVRGSGRFIFEGIRRETKKGRLWAAVRVYK